MGCLTSSQITRLKTDLVTKEAQLVIVNDTITAALGDQTASSAFDSTEGMQRITNRKLKDLHDSVSTLENEITRIENKLACKGVSYLNMRRY